MDSVVYPVGRMVDSGCGLVELLEFLRTHGTFRLTPLNFMRILNEAAGIPMTASRELLSMFDPDFRPLVSREEIEARWRTTVGSRRA